MVLHGRDGTVSKFQLIRGRGGAVSICAWPQAGTLAKHPLPLAFQPPLAASPKSDTVTGCISMGDVINWARIRSMFFGHVSFESKNSHRVKEAYVSELLIDDIYVLQI